ncbi:restriction endonuclease subunit S [Staphylococcus simulans]|uniref:restriction endonuclease subunit S n=1 Tax=Staphylococcus simulans TaxID=1286 RepID=UPI000E683D03|nr:restriction endonuclease subunit S [Staphylococcus simulans]RIN55767.1 restriction endonuclease subunit S [Staphylococcus simulans]
MDYNQLLNSILKLAMQGNLIQHEKEEDVEKVIEEIAQERKKLSLKKKLPYYDTQTEDNIPSHWRYLNLEFLTYHIGGKQNRVKKSEILNEGLYPVVSQSINQIEGYVNDSSKVLNIHDNSVIVFGDHSKTLKIIDFDFVIGADGTKIMVPIKINHKFLYYALKYNLINIKDRGYSRHFQFLKNKPIPFPPLKEQNNIVSRIEELIPKIERYGILYRDSSDINNGFPKKFKKSILQYAMQGKLVEQRENEGTGINLFNDINKEIKNKKTEKILIEDIPFDIPSSWQWVRLMDISYNIKYGYTASAQPTGSIKLLRITDIQNSNVNWTQVPYCSIEEKDVEKYLLKNKDILIARTGGTVGKSYIVDNIKQKSVFASYLIKITLHRKISINFINLYLNSPLYWKQLIDNSRGTGQPNVNATKLSNLILPLPPYEEQIRIVDKVNSLIKKFEIEIQNV